jgi:hypothetical protein
VPASPLLVLDHGRVSQQPWLTRIVQPITAFGG